MTWRRCMLAVVVAVMAMGALPSAASAAYEYGSTTKWPWSGPWWPMLDTSTPNLYDVGGPLDKYDRYLKATTGVAGGAVAYETQPGDLSHKTTVATNTWWGHCHAWAAASILTKEPGAGFTRGGITWTGDDAKGLVTELYYEPTFTMLSGVRVDTDASAKWKALTAEQKAAAYADIKPAWMDYLLRYYVRYYKYPFIMDISAGSQVWNYPVFYYQRTTTRQADGSDAVSTKVYYTQATSNYRGTTSFSRTYTYTLRYTADGGYADGGTWTGASVDNHPDFAWVPTGKKARPHLSEAKVEEILGGQDV